VFQKSGELNASAFFHNLDNDDTNPNFWLKSLMTINSPTFLSFALRKKKKKTAT
jgi:hypothetical protein